MQGRVGGAVQGSGRLTLSLMAMALPTSSYDLLWQVETIPPPPHELVYRHSL